MLMHLTCIEQNDIAVNNPIKGDAELRKTLKGTWTRTTVTTGCGGPGGGGSGSSYGPGGSGDGVLIKMLTAADGGTSMRPEQQILVFTGPKG